jgi:hypothetical protein
LFPGGGGKILATWTPGTRRGHWACPVRSCTRVTRELLTVRQPEHYRV